MPYQFDRNEATDEAIRRLAAEQIERAVGHLTQSAEPEGKRVHETRKRLKELRAVLRLARNSLGEQFIVENEAVRDAARDLAGARDTEAVLESVEKLQKRFTEDSQKKVLRKLRSALVRRRSRAKGGGLDEPMLAAAKRLEEARARVEAWKFGANDFSAIEEGLLKIYREGRRGFRSVTEEQTAEALHEWRKRVKDHWYHVQLLEEIWPAMMQPYERILARFSGVLGDHHDLFVVWNLVASPRAKMGTPQDRKMMMEMINARAIELEKEAMEIGARVYAEPSRVWLGRMRSYWEMWRRSGEAITGS